ncbi:hypothetical protein ACWEV3_00665 [Saccharopolyspora sp. NPDC003752]
MTPPVVQLVELVRDLPQVRAKASQVEKLFAHSLPGHTREQLAVILTELHTLAGWQALGLRKLQYSWQHYERAKHAARETSAESYEIHTAAEQAFVLLDLGENEERRRLVARHASAGEHQMFAAPPVLARCRTRRGTRSHHQQCESLRSFDNAAELLPTEAGDSCGPYVVLDSVHLNRWRGHALASFAELAAVDVLLDVLSELDTSFTRAETALRVDLATALRSIGEDSALRAEVEEAERLAIAIGSVRQQRRLARCKRHSDADLWRRYL